LNQIGTKRLFNGGIFAAGTAVILFGLLDRVNGHALFISLAFAVRIVEALGTAAFFTASFTITAKEFPNNISTTFASLETFFGLGLIGGPMIGAILYSIGGYFLPFISLGLLLFVVAFLTMCILPKNNDNCPSNQATVKMSSIIKIPGVMVNSLSIIATSISVGFLGATLEPHLRQFELSPVWLGTVFIINGAVYACTAPFWGWMIDKCLHPKVSALIGSTLIAGAFCLIGPTSFLPIESRLSTIMCGLLLHGLGIASILVASFTDALRTTIKCGLPDNIETYGLISGLWTSAFALGAFVGPSVSGALFDSVGFRKATIFVISCHTLVAFILILFLLLERTPKPYKELSSTESLLKGHDGIVYNEKNAKGLNNFSASVSIEQTHPSAINKQCQTWSSRCEQDSLLARTPFYGSTLESTHQRPQEQETIA